MWKHINVTLRKNNPNLMKHKNENDEHLVKDTIIHVLRYDIWLKILTITSIGLIIAGFCVPPLGIIDGSVLIGTGELAGLGALFEAGHAIDKGLDAKIKIKDIELQIHNDEIDKLKIENEIEINPEE